MFRRPLPAALATLALLTTACASEPDAGFDGTGTADLAIEQGIVFSTGVVEPGASYLKVDLIVRKNGSSNFDLKPGGTGPSDLKYMHTFDSAGGIPQTFDSLADVPDKKPSSADYGSYLSKVRSKNAVIVQNNIGTGFTKVWVEQVIASSGLVRIHYAPVAE